MKTIVLDSYALLAYADCFAAALAQQTDSEVVTGDPEFETIADRIDVRWLTSG